MSGHVEEHERVLRLLVVGELSPEDGQVTELRESCATCREQIEEMQAMVARLDAAGSFERNEIRQAAMTADAPEVEAARTNELRAIVTEHLPGSSRGTRWRLLSRARLAFTVAATVLVAVWIGTTLSQRKESGSGTGGTGAAIPLGSSGAGTEIPLGSRAAVELLEPLGDGAVGEGASFGVFRFEYASLPRGGTFEVYVYDGRPSAANVEQIGRSGAIDTTVWEPTLEDTTEWPDEIHWEVVAFDMQGVEVARSEPRLVRRSSD